MIASLKAEFRKLLTVRSTYILILLMLALTIFFAFYVEGVKANGFDVSDPNLLSHDIFLLVSNISIFSAIIAVLTLTHEYRYNTIMYTLTASNSRAKSLVAKFLTITIFAAVTTAGIVAVGLVAVKLGLHLSQFKHAALVPQALHYGDFIWRTLFYGWSTAIVGLLLATLLRNQVASIAALFLIPTAEQLLSLLLKTHSVYLPFMAQSAILTVPEGRLGAITPGNAALVFGGYLVIGWIVALVLFVRRDAN